MVVQSIWHDQGLFQTLNSIQNVGVFTRQVYKQATNDTLISNASNF